MHPERRFVVTGIASAEKLAMMLTAFTWTICSGFEHGGLLFLNDSTSEDGAQEYAVIKDSRQVGSITFGWCTEEEAGGYIRTLLAGDFVDLGPAESIIEPATGHSCPLCR